MALSNVKGLHTTPGIYQKETELRATRTSATGITTLGLVGETLQGPAFTPIFIDNWRNFVNVFGGTSSEQYTGSKYPRYELPYIAQDYLTESSQLYVTRVLGLSGYNAGKAWLIKSIGSGDGNNMLIGIIRSRGNYIKTFGLPKFSDEPITQHDENGKPLLTNDERFIPIEKYVQYVVGRSDQSSIEPLPANAHIIYDGKEYAFGQKFFGTNVSQYTRRNKEVNVYGYCGTNYEYDKFLWEVENVWIAPAGQASVNFTCGTSGNFNNTEAKGIPCTPTDLGTFKLVCELRDTGSGTSYVSYTVSLNPGSSEYIYNVLGGTPQGITPIWIEELYDVALQNLVAAKATDPSNYIEGILLGENVDIKDVNGEKTTIYDGLSEQGESETIMPHWKPVKGILTKVNSDLRESDLNDRYLYSYNESVNTDYFIGLGTNNGDTLGKVADDGKILIVKRDIVGEGRVSYNYHYLDDQLETIAEKNPYVLDNEFYKYVFVTDENLLYEKEDLSGGGTGAAAIAKLGEGRVIHVNVIDPGSGYNENDITITIDSPTAESPTNKTAKVGQIVLNDAGGIIKVELIEGGRGYDDTIYGPIDEPINPIHISGSYTKEAKLSIEWGCPINNISVGMKGDNYITKPLVRISSPENPHGTIATAEAIVKNGQVVSMRITNPGSGYQSVPNIQIGVDNLTLVQRVIGDVSNYKDAYRTPVTPWVVSQMIGSFANNEVKKLFRFFTISDGTNANTLFKISIININPDSLTFDILVRDFYDNDGSPKILEQFKGCNLNPASYAYILNSLGDVNGSTIQRSSFVMVEVADNDTIKYCIPAGYLGIPVRYFGADVKKPQLAFNRTIFEGIKPKKQFFGFSDLTGIDVDCLTYKGKSAYTDGYYTDGFHLDSRVNNCSTLVDGINVNVDCTGTDPDYYTNGVFTWQTPSMNIEGYDEPPMMTTNGDIIGTIYEDINYRKFTICFYGGFDGWDPYRTYRTTGDEFKRSKYKGRISPISGSGDRFSVLTDDYGIPAGGITSDYYAFWAGYETMGNPFATPINIFATPGIDYVNNTLLFKEALDVVERDYNQKTIYFVTTPDKPLGANDNVSNMYTPLDVVGNLDIAEIDSSYTATYYPWCQYYDANENKAIYLPVTKDIIKLVTQIDNVSYSWYPAAGINNGQIDCVAPRRTLKMEETDILTGSRINPVVKFSRQGIYSWGQKNLKVSYDNDREPLTRIGVRRMMIRLKEMVESVNRGLLFTPNDMTTANKFKSNTSAILNDVRSNRGISDYRIEVDNSVEARENRTLPAKVWIKPNSMLEFIEIEWVITPQGMEMV